MPKETKITFLNQKFKESLIDSLEIMHDHYKATYNVFLESNQENILNNFPEAGLADLQLLEDRIDTLALKRAIKVFLGQLPKEPNPILKLTIGSLVTDYYEEKRVLKELGRTYEFENDWLSYMEDDQNNLDEMVLRFYHDEFFTNEVLEHALNYSRKYDANKDKNYWILEKIGGLETIAKLNRLFELEKMSLQASKVKTKRLASHQ